MTLPPDFVLFLGRFHVLWVLLPVGRFVRVPFLERLAAGPRFKNASAALGPMLALAVPGFSLSAVCAGLISLGGGPNATASTAPPNSGSLAEKPAFAEVVKPVFDRYCVSCHGPEKAKAGLRFDSHADVVKGGDNGPILVPGKPSDSIVLQRLRLPLEHADRMPPDGKPQPSAADIALLEGWIAAGAPSDKRVGELPRPPPIPGRLGTSAAAPATPPPAAPKPLADVQPAADALSEELSVAISALSPNEPWLQCNASLAGTNFGDADLAKLASLAANLRWLDLAGTRVTDHGLAPVTAMRNLTRLHLERTAITDAGLAHVAGLAELEYLNLYATPVTDAALETLKSLPKLRQLYLWRSQVTPEAAKAFAEARVDQEQILKWEQEIKQLQYQIRNQRMAVHFGAPATAAADTGPVPINTVCPVSGKSADRTKTLLLDAKLVAFCCDDCKAKFSQDPKPFLAKLGLGAANPDSPQNK